MKKNVLSALALSATLLCFGTSVPTAKAESIIVQSTTSTDNAGFYNHVVPLFSNQTGIEVKVVAVGTGQALQNARNCDGDLLIVHSTKDEIAFVKDGYGVARHDLMYNDFVILGPKSDPAGISGTTDIGDALGKIAAAKASFASRGDNSGTHKAEKRLWQTSDVSKEALASSWYKETGRGMGATLNYAVQTESYVLSDRATWLAFGNQQDHQILFEGDPRLFNQYGVVTINPDKCPKVKAKEADRFAEWLLSAEGQAHISTLKRAGQPLFFPNAK